jgi:hypothetical protein
LLRLFRISLQNAHNVLVASSSVARHGMVAKVADLGLSRVLKQYATHRTTSTVSSYIIVDLVAWQAHRLGISSLAPQLLLPKICSAPCTMYKCWALHFKALDGGHARPLLLLVEQVLMLIFLSSSAAAAAVAAVAAAAAASPRSAC